MKTKEEIFAKYELKDPDGEGTDCLWYDDALLAMEEYATEVVKNCNTPAVSNQRELYFAFMAEYNALMGKGEHQILKEEVEVLLAKYVEPVGEGLLLAFVDWFVNVDDSSEMFPTQSSVKRFLSKP